MLRVVIDCCAVYERRSDAGDAFGKVPLILHGVIAKEI